eukprot:COSAG02_NODE_25184_length_666_cov_1.097002_2_plen_56_part_01
MAKHTGAAQTLLSLQYERNFVVLISCRRSDNSEWPTSANMVAIAVVIGAISAPKAG